MLVAQSFLATAAVILLANAKHAASPQGFYWLTLLIAGLMILIGVITDFSLTAARLAQRYARGGDTVYERLFPFSGEKADDWRRCLQSHTALTERVGFLSASWLPVITNVAWTSFVYYCVVQVLDRNVAVTAFLVSFILVMAAFVGIRLLLKGDRVSR
jgi:hypothetical protein